MLYFAKGLTATIPQYICPGFRSSDRNISHPLASAVDRRRESKNCNLYLVFISKARSTFALVNIMLVGKVDKDISVDKFHAIPSS